MDFLNYLSDIALNYAYAFTYATIVVVFLLVNSFHKRKYIKLLIIGYSFMATGIFFITLRSVAPLFVTVILGNVFLIMGSSITVNGQLTMLHRQIKHNIFIILTLLFTIIHVIFTYINQDVTIRIVNYVTFSLIITLIFILRMFFHLMDKQQSVVTTIFATYLFDIFYLSYRMINALGFEKVQNLFRGSSVLKGFIIFSILMAIVRTICILIYHTEDLLEDHN